MRSALVLILLAALLIAGVPTPAVAATVTTASPAETGSAPPPAGLTSAEAQQLLRVLQNPQERQQLIDTLESIEKIMPVLATDTAPAGATTAPKPTPSKAAAKTVSLKPNSLGADILASAGSLVGEIDASLIVTITSVTDYGEFGSWADGLSQNPTILGSVLQAIWRLAVVLITGLACEQIVWRFTRRFYVRLGHVSGKAEAEAATGDPDASPDDVAPDDAGVTDALPTDAVPADAVGREAVEAAAADDAVTAVRGRKVFQHLVPLHSGWLLLKRLPYILLAMVVDAVPPLVFLGAASLVFATPVAGNHRMRLTAGAVVNAYVVCRLLLVAARGIFCSPTPKLRLLHVSNRAAAFLTVWCRRIALVAVFGAAVIQIGIVSGMSLEMQRGLGRLFGLAIHIMLIIMVLKRRREVEAWLRGRPSDRRTAWQQLKARLASVWHIQAIVLIVLVWIVYATAVRNGIGHPLHLILETMGLLILFRVMAVILLGAVGKAFAISAGAETGTRSALITARAGRYQAPLRMLVQIAMSVIFVIVLLQLWGVDAMTWFQVGGLGGRLVSSFGTILVTLVIAVIVWETINFFMQIYMDDLSQQGAYMRAARLRTVLPILRNTLLIALMIVIVLTALSEIGVNIGPLLAGASILGVAIGFGSQKLVQDFITGIFLLLENAMQVGDWVTAAGLSGSVENLSIRTLRLRAGDGSVHIIPFSSVSTVTNNNRGLGNMVISITVSYDEDTDAVGEVLKEISVQMRQEDAYKDGLLSDFQYWGVDAVDGTTATLTGQLPCTDSARWSIKREFNRRMKLAFQEKGIRLIPSSTMIGFQHPLDVRVDATEIAKARPGMSQTIEGQPEDGGGGPQASQRKAGPPPGTGA